MPVARGYENDRVLDGGEVGADGCCVRARVMWWHREGEGYGKCASSCSMIENGAVMFSESPWSDKG